MRRAPVAIELGERWLKVAVAKPGVSAPQLHDGLAESIAGFTDPQIAETVAEALAVLDVKPKPLTLCLPRNLAIVRNLRLPSQDPAELAQMVDLNIVRIVPYRRDEVLSSYRLLGVDEAGYSKIMLAIVQRELVKRHVHILEAAWLSVDRILLSSHGVWRWTVSRHSRADLSDREPSLLLDVDSAFTDFIVCSRDQLFFSRSIAIESGQLTEEAGLSRLLNEVSLSLGIFQKEEMNKRPVKVFLSGSGVSAASLEQAIADGLKIPVVKVLNPAALFKKDLPAPAAYEPPADLSMSAVAQMVSDGDESQFPFVLPEIQIRQTLRQKTRELILLGNLVIYLLTLIAGIFMSRFSHQQAYLKQLQARNAAIRLETGDLLLQAKRTGVVKTALGSRELPLRYLAELERIVPPEIAVEFLSVDEQRRGIIRGQALQLSDVFRFTSTLENSKHIEQVEAKYTRRKRTRDKELTEFELAMRVHL